MHDFLSGISIYSLMFYQIALAKSQHFSSLHAIFFVDSTNSFVQDGAPVPEFWNRFHTICKNFFHKKDCPPDGVISFTPARACSFFRCHCYENGDLQGTSLNGSACTGTSRTPSPTWLRPQKANHPPKTVSSIIHYPSRQRTPSYLREQNVRGGGVFGISYSGFSSIHLPMA